MPRTYGGLIGTVTDAARLAAAHVAGPWDAHRVLAHDNLESMRTICAGGKPFDHGIGWFRKPADAHRTQSFVEHYGTGAGFWNAMRIYPESRLAVGGDRRHHPQVGLRPALCPTQGPAMALTSTPAASASTPVRHRTGPPWSSRATPAWRI